MAVLINRSYLQASSNLATDLARYGSTATWRGVYYRGEKIGFTVSQTVARGDGFDLEEDGRLQMALLGATTPATIRTTAHVDKNFALRSFEFSLDPGTGPIQIAGAVITGDPERVALQRSDPKTVALRLTVKTASGTRTEERLLDEPPALSLNLSRRLANGGLVTGARHRWTVFDPATLRNAPVVVDVGRREVVIADGRPVPAFRVEMEFSGLRTASWLTDTGEVVREESPLGLLTVRESAERARAMAVPLKVQTDMYDAAAIVPNGRERIDEPRDVRRLRVRLTGVDLSQSDLDGIAQTSTRSAASTTIDIHDPQSLSAVDADTSASSFLGPEPLIESDDPDIVREAQQAVRGVRDRRAQAERLTRVVNGLLEKKPTVSIPSAREVLRTRVGDCNEHTALFVAMARAVGIPARIAVGLVFVRGAFYYHAWPEVYIDSGNHRGLWLPVDPTLNEFPADATHIRLARGGLDKQTVILPLIGRLKMDVLDVDVAPNTRRVLAGASVAVRPVDLGSLAIPLPTNKTCCACSR